MLRSSATFAFVLAELLVAASAGCSASTPSRVVSSHEDLVDSITPQVGPGTVDVGNVFLPTVSVFTLVHYSGGIKPAPCSGVLVDPLVVITAAHCVCAPRAPTPQDRLLLETFVQPLRDAGTMRPRDEMAMTDIFDGRSTCATYSLVTTIVYGKPGEKSYYQPVQYQGRVLVHPEFELVLRTKNGKPWTFRNHADLAAIYLDRPVPFPPIGLPDSEVKVGDALEMAGYGPRNIGDHEDYGPRRFGPNTVTRFVNVGNGNVLIVAADPPSPDGGVPSNLRRGDSGGPCVRKGDPNVLVGIATTLGQLGTGAEISYFTSAFRNKSWILERILQARPPADAGLAR